MIKVSIIVPNYNHAPYLHKRLESVFNQSYQDFEVILLDDCSTDNSVKILEKYANHPKVSHFIINEENSGSPFKQWRKGVALAEGEYIWIAESDDWAEPTFLEELVPMLENGCDLSYCRSVRVEEDKVLDNDYFWPDGLDSKRWKQNFTNDGFDEIRNYLVYRNTIPNASACLFRKSLANLPKELDQMKFCGDWLFWIKLLFNRNSKIAYLASRLNYFRIHRGTSRSIKKAEIERHRLSEYFYTITIARKLSNRNFLLPVEYKKYNWIFKEIENKSFLIKDQKFFPPIPFNFYIAYYIKRFNFKKIMQQSRQFAGKIKRQVFP